MSGSNLITPIEILAFYSILLIPASLLLWLKLVPLLKNLLIAVVRMSVQLALIAVYLEYLFTQNQLWLNLLWLLVMMVVANIHILNKTKLRKRFFFVATFASLLTSTAVSMLAMITITDPTPWYQTQYLIPLAGMLLGNCLNGNVLVLERLFSAVSAHYDSYQADVLLGATPLEALHRHLQAAITAALSPIIATLSTLGIVSLPGMMTGQILGGAQPSNAVMYQMMIMTAVASAMTLCTLLNALLCIRLGFDGYGNLRLERLQTA